jgi:DNA (cytosine-5)-methyltransferase 1
MAFSFIDLFAGCGGLSLGLMQAGGTGVLAVEKSPDAFKTLWHNLAEAKGLAAFQWPETIPAQAHEIRTLLSTYDGEVEKLSGKVDLVAGGPPCQGFSMYGKRNPHDKRNQLWTEYLRFIEKTKPSAVLLENVEGIDRPFISGRQDSGRQCRETAALRIMKSLQKLGFVTQVLQLCASDYGVPQYRPRFFLVGFRCDKAVAKAVLTDDLLAQVHRRHMAALGLQVGQQLTVKQALSDLEIQGKELVDCPDSKRFHQAKYGGPLSA